MDKESFPHFEDFPKDDNPDYGSAEIKSVYSKRLKKDREKLGEHDKQERVNKAAREALERLNKLGPNPKLNKDGTLKKLSESDSN